jgi:hypothetical protein
MSFNPRNGQPPANGMASAPTAPEQIEMQAVRELLFGESQRALETRIQKLEAQTAAMEQGLSDRFRELSLRFEELARTSEAQQAAIRDIGRAFTSFGQQLGSGSAREAGGPSPYVSKPE